MLVHFFTISNWESNSGSPSEPRIVILLPPKKRAKDIIIQERFNVSIRTLRVWKCIKFLRLEIPNNFPGTICRKKHKQLIHV